MSIRTLAAALLALTSQLLLGVVLVSFVAGLLAGGRARRRWLASWAAAGRVLRRAAPWTIAALAGSVALTALSHSSARSATAAIWGQPLWFLTLGAIPTASCVVMLQAGREEARGRLGRARRLARLAGQLLFLGNLALLVLVWYGLLFRVSLRRALILESPTAGVVLLAAMLSLGLAAFVGVLGGLSGKPRPSSYFAGAFHLGGVAGLIAAFQMTL